MSHRELLAQDARLHGTIVYVDTGDDESVAPLIPAMRARFPAVRFLRVDARPDAHVAAGSMAPDVVFSGQGLPRMDGLALLSAIREHCPAASRILVCTTTSASRAIRAINAGHVDAFLRSPVDGEELATIIREGVSAARRGRSDARTRPRRARGDILIVDHDPHIHDVLHRFFGQKLPDVYVFAARSAETGMDILARHHVDLVVADHRLPDMLGTAFLAEAHRLYPQARKVLVTGDPGKGLAHHATPDKGVDRIFIRPVDMVAFTRSVDALLPRGP